MRHRHHTMRLRLQVVVGCWFITMLAALTSVIFWGLGVCQLGTWQACFPAVALVTGLFSVTASVLWIRPFPWGLQIVVPSSVLATLWCLAVATGF